MTRTRTLKRTSVACLLTLFAALRCMLADQQPVPLIHSIVFAPLGANDKKFQLLGDRFEYWADDVNGQFYVQLDAPTNATVRSLKVALKKEGSDKAIGEVTHPNAIENKAHWLIRTGALAVGKYSVSAVILDAEGKPLGDPQSFQFSRSDKRNPVIPIPSEGIRIQVEEQSALKDAVWPMQVGVPMPINALTDTKRLALFEDGKQVAANITPIATWCPQGPVKWVHLDFNGRYRGGKPADYRLKLVSQPAAIAPPLKVEQTDDKIVVDTGTIRFEVNRKKFAGIEAAWVDGIQVIKGAGGPYIVDGRLIRGDASGDKNVQVLVEEQGPARVTIAASGWYTDPSGRSDPFCMFKTRITAFAGQPMLRISQHTILSFDTRQYRLADVGFQIATPDGERFSLGADGKSEAGELPKTDTMFLHQDRWDHFRLVGTGTNTIEGARSDGWFNVASKNAGVSVLLRDVWQKFPKEVELGRDGMTVHFWPKHGQRVFKPEDELDIKNIYKYWCFHQGSLLNLVLPNDFYDRLRTYPDTLIECKPEYALNGNGEGLAIGNEFALLFAKAGDVGQLPAWSQMFQRDPAALASPQWNADSGAFGDIAPADRERFGPQEDSFEKGWLSWTKCVERGNEYGMWIYPDTHTYWNVADNAPGLHRVWHSSHYHEVGNTWPAYFRTGSPDLLRWARANTDHFINIDTVNYGSLNKEGRPTFKQHIAGAMYHCKAPTPWGSRDYGMDRNDTDIGLWGHWVDPDAPLWYWYIGSNPRAKDVYDLWAGSGRKWGAPLGGTRREACTSLAYALTYYQATWDADILPSIHGLGYSMRTAEPLEKQFPGPLWHVLWINRYYEQTRDPSYVADILKWARSSWSGDAWALNLYALAYELSGDKTYLTGNLDRLKKLPSQFFHATGDPYDWYGLGPGPLGFQWGDMGWGLFLKQLHRAGINELPSASSVGAGYPMTTGNDAIDYTNTPPSLVVYALNESGRGLTVFNKLRGLSGDLWPVSFSLFSPSGKRIHFIQRIKASPDGDPVAVPKGAEPGLYRIEYRSGSFYGGVATDSPHEAALIRGGAGYRTDGTVAYLQPVGPPKPVEITMASSDDRRPCNFSFMDADEKEIAHGSLFAPRPQKTVIFTIDPAKHKFPWRLEANGIFMMTLKGDKEEFLLAFSPESLSAIASKLAQNEKQAK